MQGLRSAPRAAVERVALSNQPVIAAQNSLQRLLCRFCYRDVACSMSTSSAQLFQWLAGALINAMCRTMGDARLGLGILC